MGQGLRPAWPRQKFRILRGPNIATEFKAMVIDYIDQHYGAGANVPQSTVTAAE
jgi:(E)-4-hydroxy-3-methylbut-2-enyl-diphosphate synthase